MALRKARREDVTVGQLKNPEALHDILVKDQAFQFLQQVHGSLSYWQHAQYKLLAMVRAKEIFTWFLTLSCADLSWPETLQAIALQQGRQISDENVKNMAYEEKCKLLRQNPVTAGCQFDHRLQAIFRDVLISKKAPLGKVVYYFQRTEFQLRGSPHCHAVLWIEDAPSPQSAEDKDVVAWIDQFVTCKLPDEDDPLREEVLTNQRHWHSVAYRKKGNHCRFYFPKSPSTRTIFAKPKNKDSPELAAQWQKIALEVLAKVFTV